MPEGPADSAASSAATSVGRCDVSDVVTLAAVTPAPVPEVVEMLEHWLERARAGEVRSIGVAADVDDGSAECSWHTEDRYAFLHLAVHELTRSVVAAAER